jgi:hypothetical protein
LWVTTSDAVRLPLAAGAKATSTLQLAPAAMALPQLVAICRNSLACAPVMAMPLSASGALPLLLTRTVCAADTVPVTWLNVSAGGVSTATGTGVLALPERATVDVDGLALWLKVSVPEATPATVGAKAMLAVQLAPAARLRPVLQVPPLTMNPALVVTAPSSSGALPLLASVAVCTVLLAPTSVVAKASDPGLAVATGAAGKAPVPASETTVVAGVALCEKVSVPLAAPVAVGRNDTPIAQLDPAATVPPALHVPAETTNGPVTANEIGPSAALPLLARVTVCAALVEPTAVAAKLTPVGVALAVGVPAPAGLPR